MQQKAISLLGKKPSRYEKWEAAHFSMLEKLGTGVVTAMTHLRHGVRTHKHITVSPIKPGEFVYGMKSVLITTDLQCSSRTCFLYSLVLFNNARSTVITMRLEHDLPTPHLAIYVGWPWYGKQKQTRACLLCGKDKG